MRSTSETISKHWFPGDEDSEYRLLFRKYKTDLADNHRTVLGPDSGCPNDRDTKPWQQRGPPPSKAQPIANREVRNKQVLLEVNKG